ncbi:MerR family transcriptional regulator [Saccharothrix deserti]|uniref:MerR family transcriptional regulator n=1 Tax=Saccharothrix deserti TaxID=2593674 RepID=UPI00131A9710|nr:MerR family transcriptional regulator [Saccharothrix deserti]
MSEIRIAKLAEITGFAPTTIRYYENTGLLPAASRSSSGHRVYTDHDVDRLRFIARGKQMGFALDEIRELILTCGGDPITTELDQVMGTLRSRIVEVNERIAELSAFSAQLMGSLWAARSNQVPDTPGAEPVCQEHWARALAHPHTHTHVEGLLTLTFRSSPALTVALAELVAHESGCQQPTGVLLHCTSRTTVLQVVAAENTRRLIDDLIVSVARDSALGD